MQSVREPVKGRTDAGRRREQRARATRDRIVRAATARFVDRGYVATTVETIAASAGVAVATVYQAFGTKAAILARCLDVAIAGDDDPVAVLDRDWVAAAGDEPDPRRRLIAVVTGAAGIAARTAPLKEVMRDAAATEPAIRELVDRDDAQRLATQRALVTIVLAAPPSDDALATFYALVNSHSYRLASTQLGWDEAAWRRWLIDVLARQLGLDDLKGRRRSAGRA
jgi:AcrR family transcriptional regulator